MGTNKKIAFLGTNMVFDTKANITSIDYGDKKALMDYDIIVAFPYLVSNTSTSYMPNHLYWKKEIEKFLQRETNMYVFVLPQHINTFNIFPFSFLNKEEKTGTNILPPENNIFNTFYKTYKEKFFYQITYSQTEPPSKVLFTGRDKKHLLGSLLKQSSKGDCILLPYINIFERNRNSIYVSHDLNQINEFVQIITDIDDQLSTVTTGTHPPEWVQNEIYQSTTEIDTISKIAEVENNIHQLEQNIKDLHDTLDKEKTFKGLLFETGKALENIIIESLHVLEYKANNFTNKLGNEIDIVLEAPEGHIYCAECEGKENKQVDITKFRQLLDNINVYEEHLNDNTAYIYGILFGNAFRLSEISNRLEIFTTSCVERAKKKNIILIRTHDLYPIVQYLREHNNEEFRKECRDVIHNSIGKIVQFPSVPKQS